MKNDEHAKARNLFFETELTQAQIAAFLGISEKTLSLWANEGKWKRLRQLARQTPLMMIDEMYGEVYNLNRSIKERGAGKQFPTLQEAETRRKILTSIRYIKEQQSPGAHAEVLMNFTSYVIKRNLEDAQSITKYADQYMKGEQPLPQGNFKPYGMPYSAGEPEDIAEQPIKEPPPQPGSAI